MNILSKKTNRRGITLTESLIAMGVAAIGMFGVFVLIPFCGRQAELGLDYDQSAEAAKVAVERFEIMRMNNPNAWAFANGARFNAAPYTPPHFPIPYVNQWRGSSVCIDPRMLTRDSTRITFPHFTAGQFESDNMTAPPVNSPPLMNRLTVFNRNGLPLTQANAGLGSAALADHYFQMDNDLILIEPADKQALPAQQFEANGAVQLERASKGKMSWMTMISPQPVSPASDLYRMYIIVFKNRSMDPDPLIRAEAVYDIEFQGPGYGGGDAIMNPFYTLPNSGTEIFPPAGKEFRIRRNSWMMVCRNLQATNTPVFGWYKVSKFNFDIGNNIGNVSLEGSDWTPSVDTANTLGVRAGSNPNTPSHYRDFAVFLPDVVMVYEKTIRLESPSMWNTE